MPNYQWYAINLAGVTQQGVCAARNVKDLDNQLLQQEKALLSCRRISCKSLLRPVKTSTILSFFKQVATLIDSGIFLDQALTVLREQTDHVVFRQVINELFLDVKQGYSFGDALGNQDEFFDLLTVSLVKAGQESGTLPQALQHVCDYQEAIDSFYKKVRQAMMMPLITLLFFVVIALVIFIAVVPTFAKMFVSSGQEIPFSTRMIIGISNWLQSNGGLLVLAGFLCGALCAMRWVKTLKIRRVLDRLVLRMPLVGTLVTYLNLSRYFQALCLLVQGGVDIAQALTIARGSVSNSVIREKLGALEQNIIAGSSVHNALQQAPQLFRGDVIALVCVGEESGMLGFMFGKAAELYGRELNRLLSLITIVVQPALMLVLGLLITFLIFAVYLPIFNLSQVVS